MVVIIVAAGHRLYFIKAKVIGVCLFKGKYDIDKVFAQLNNVCKPGTRREGDHGLCRMHRYLANLEVFIYKVIEQVARVL
jgi:hypothetical protein